jgi:hypothetical protein
MVLPSRFLTRLCARRRFRCSYAIDTHGTLWRTRSASQSIDPARMIADRLSMWVMWKTCVSEETPLFSATMGISLSSCYIQRTERGNQFANRSHDTTLDQTAVCSWKMRGRLATNSEPRIHFATSPALAARTSVRIFARIFKVSDPMRLRSRQALGRHDNCLWANQ